MLYRITLITVLIGLLFVIGCRTGEYKVDLEIYERMPGLLTADPDIADNLFYNEDGSLKVLFEKGEMHLWLAFGLDEQTRMQVISDALMIFHEQYMNDPLNKRKDDTYYRELIFIKGFVEDTELYVIQWDLNDENPDITSNRFGNFM